MKRARVLCVVLAAALLGCSGGSSTAPVPVTPIDPMISAKATLEAMAVDGQIGSGLEEVRMSLEKLKETDPAKGEALLQEYDALAKAGTPDQVRAKAKALLEKL